MARTGVVRIDQASLIDEPADGTSPLQEYEASILEPDTRTDQGDKRCAGILVVFVTLGDKGGRVCEGSRRVEAVQLGRQQKGLVEQDAPKKGLGA